MRTRNAAILALAAIALTLLAPLGVSARTNDPSGVAAAQVRALAAIDRRLETLDRIQDVVSSSGHVTDGHRGALLGEVGSHRGGLSALAAEIGNTDDPSELRRLIPTIATDFRIYLVFVPKVTGVLASDAAISMADRATSDVVPRLEDWIDRVEAAGGDVEEAESHLEDLEAAIDEVATLASGIADSLLPLGAADWEDPARAVIEQARADGEAARVAAKEGVEAARAVIEALRRAAA